MFYSISLASLNKVIRVSLTLIEVKGRFWIRESLFHKSYFLVRYLSDFFFWVNSVPVSLKKNWLACHRWCVGWISFLSFYRKKPSWHVWGSRLNQKLNSINQHRVSFLQLINWSFCWYFSPVFCSCFDGAKSRWFKSTNWKIKRTIRTKRSASGMIVIKFQLRIRVKVKAGLNVCCVVVWCRQTGRSCMFFECVRLGFLPCSWGSFLFFIIFDDKRKVFFVWFSRARQSIASYLSKNKLFEFFKT